MKQITQQMLEKMRAAKSAEELIAIAKADGESLSEAEAAAILERLHRPTGEVSDEELTSIAGGGCGSSPSTEDPAWESDFQVGDRVLICKPSPQPCRKCSVSWEVVEVYANNYGVNRVWYVALKCPVCGEMAFECESLVTPSYGAYDSVL